MFKIIKIPKKLIQAVNKDILICLSKLFDKKVLNQDSSDLKIIDNNANR